MKPYSILISRSLAVACMRLVSSIAVAAAPQVLDDYSDPQRSKTGVERVFVTDAGVGGSSKAVPVCTNGVLAVKGELSPGRGMPAFVSQVCLLAAGGMPKDLSAYQGLRVRLRGVQGVLAVQVATTDVKNFDYHTSSPLAVKPGGFQDISIPFKDLKRAWSEPTALNLKSVTSINLVSFGTARGSFAYEIDELGLY